MLEQVNLSYYNLLLQLKMLYGDAYYYEFLRESTPNLILSVTFGSGLNTGQLAPLAFFIVISNFVDNTSYREFSGLISSYNGIVAEYRFRASNANSTIISRGENVTFRDDLSIFLAKTARTQVC